MEYVYWTIAIVVFLVAVISKSYAKKPVKKPKYHGTITTRRPTATRTVTGGLLAGPVGALAGFAFRKKGKESIEIHED